MDTIAQDVVGHRRRPPAHPRAWLRRAGTCTLAAVLVLAGGMAQAGEFDARTRGILFRIEAPPPVPTGPTPAGEAAGVEGGAPAQAAGSPPGTATDAGLPAAPVASAPAAESAAATPAGAEPRVSHVFATIHYGNPDTLLLYLPRLRAHLAESTVLVNEVDLEEAWKPEYETYRLLSSGRTLRRLIGEDAFAELQRQLPEVAPQTLDALKPWVVMSMLEFPFGQDAHESIDQLLQKWASEGGLAREHLENLPDQLAALDCVPADEYALVLQQRLLSGWSFDLDAERTVGYYRERDLAAWLDDIDSLHGLTGRALAAESEIRRCLISLRNERWLPVLESRLRQGGAFVAVGAIHLTGHEGLLAQLSRRGFVVSVEPW